MRELYSTEQYKKITNNQQKLTGGEESRKDYIISETQRKFKNLLQKVDGSNLGMMGDLKFLNTETEICCCFTWLERERDRYTDVCIYTHICREIKEKW